MISLLYIVGEYPSKTETFIAREIELMHQRGVNIFIFSLSKCKTVGYYGPVKNDGSKCFYPNWSVIFFCFNLVKVAKIIKERKRSKPGKSLESSKNIRNVIRTLKDIFLTMCVIEIVKRNNITHLHAHFASYPTDITLLVAGIMNIPFSFSAHAHDIYTQTKDNLVAKVEKAKFVVTCTKYNYDYLISICRRVLKNSGIHCIYHGINSNDWKSHTRPKRYNYDYNINILTIARLVEKKGLFYLIEAVEILLKRNYRVNCTIIGSGPLYNELNELISLRNISPRITILDKQNRKEIANHFYKNDFFVLPCLIANNGDRDGLPNVLLEALASGTPVITTPVSAIPELIQDNKTGFFVPEKSSTAIVDTICNLIEQPELCRTVAFNGMQKVKVEFDSSYWGEQFYQLFISELTSIA